MENQGGSSWSAIRISYSTLFRFLKIERRVNLDWWNTLGFVACEMPDQTDSALILAYHLFPKAQARRDDTVKLRIIERAADKFQFTPHDLINYLDEFGHESDD